MMTEPIESMAIDIEDDAQVGTQQQQPTEPLSPTTSIPIGTSMSPTMRASQTSSSRQKRPTPPLPVELIKPPVNRYSEELFSNCGDELVVTDLRSQVHHQSDMTNNSVHDSFGTKLNPMASSTTNSKISNGSIEKLMKPPLPKKVPNDGMNIDMETFNRAETGYVIDTTSSGGNSSGLCAFLLTVISVILIVVTLPFSMFLCIKVVQEYERAVIFRLGRLVKGGAKGPGIFFIIPCIDSYCKVDLRTVSFDVPPQEILSRDSVTVSVDAVVYFRISNATVAVSNVEDYGRSTRLLAATTLRNVLGTKDLSQILSERESISHVMQSSLDEATDPWGVKVERVEIKDVRLPVQLQRAMAAEAEAAREARAKVIAAEGEHKASRALKEAAEVMTHNSAALQLRYLQTLSSIAAEKNSTIVFPIPLELFKGLIDGNNK